MYDKYFIVLLIQERIQKYSTNRKVYVYLIIILFDKHSDLIFYYLFKLARFRSTKLPRQKLCIKHYQTTVETFLYLPNLLTFSQDVVFNA